MKDRVPVNPGRVKITPEGGSAYYATMVRADNPTQEGTPLNKASLLKDTTAALYGLGTDAVPDEVLVKLDGSRPKVGDIKYTARTDLDETWLLCNGETISASSYPDLFNILAASGVNGEWTLSPISGLISNPGTVKSTLFVNGYYIIAAYNSNNSSYFIHYTNDFLGAWNTYEITGGWSSEECALKYVNGYYVLTHGAYIHYAANPGGPWSYKQIADSSHTYPAILDIDYDNGYYVVCGRWGGTYNKLISYSTEIGGTWSTKYDNLGTRGQLVSITHGNGYFVVLSPSNSTDSKGLEIMYTTNPSSNTWTSVPIRSYGGSSYSFGEIIYEDGKFVFAAEKDVFSAVDPTASANWSMASQFSAEVMGISLERNEYIVQLLPGLMRSAGLSGPWEQITTPSLGSSSGLSFASDGTTYCYSNYSNIAYIILGSLPTITSDKSYAYIKALGDSSGGTGESEGIAFTVNSIQYQAEDGMTWAEWLASDYNTNPGGGGYAEGFENGQDMGVGDYAVLFITFQPYAVCASGSPVSLHDTIAANTDYTIAEGYF